jgi:hypothetical protein
MAHDVFELAKSQSGWQTFGIRSDIAAHEWTKGTAPAKIRRYIDHCGFAIERTASRKESAAYGMAADAATGPVDKIATETDQGTIPALKIERDWSNRVTLANSAFGILHISLVVCGHFDAEHRC